MHRIVCTCTVAYSGGGWQWCDREFCTVFVRFVSQLNRKIRVQRLLLTVRVFCLLKTAENAPKIVFGEGAQPTTPNPTNLDAYGASHSPY